MITEQELKQYKEWGLHLIPLKDDTKNLYLNLIGRRMAQENLNVMTLGNGTNMEIILNSLTRKY